VDWNLFSPGRLTGGSGLPSIWGLLHLDPPSLVEVIYGSGHEVLDAPHQPWLAVLGGCEGDGEHGGEAEGGVDGDLNF